jgi:hypothetical protein
MAQGSTDRGRKLKTANLEQDHMTTAGTKVNRRAINRAVPTALGQGAHRSRSRLKRRPETLVGASA